MHIQGNEQKKPYQESRKAIVVEKKANMSFELGIGLNFFF